MPDEYAPCAIQNRGYQSVLVAANVKNGRAATRKIRALEVSFDFVRMPVFFGAHDRFPGAKRRIGVRVIPGKSAQSRLGDDMQADLLLPIW